jgi:hypothetical protein
VSWADPVLRLNPPPPGWVERMPPLNMRELLSVVAGTDEAPAWVRVIKETLAPCYVRD